MQNVYILTPYGVGPQVPVGVYDSRWRAEKAAKELWPKTDGYHGFEIERRILNKTYENTFSYGIFAGRKPTTKPPRIKHVKESEAGRRP